LSPYAISFLRFLDVRVVGPEKSVSSGTKTSLPEVFRPSKRAWTVIASVKGIFRDFDLDGSVHDEFEELPER
jgi:hypothetical protein